jgi:beta-lactamase class A
MKRNVEAAISRFVEEEHRRAVALRVLRGPAMEVLANADESLPAASLIKVPVALTLYDLADKGQVDLGKRVLRGELGTTVYPSILEIFRQNHSFALGELCGLMLATSDNPTSQYLIDLVGIEAVNNTIQRLGANATKLVVGFSDPDLRSPGRANVTTARDTVEIMSAVASVPAYRSILHAMRNSMRNFRLPLRLPDDLYVAHKTGSLSGVVNDAAIVLGQNVDITIALLSEEQVDTGYTNIAMADCMLEIWAAFGERVD